MTKLYQCIHCKISINFGKTKANKYCGASCQQTYQFRQYIEQWKAGIKSGDRGKYATSKHIRRYLLEKFNNTCCNCGTKEWLGQPIILELEHIDGDSSNHKEENLTLLCPNCHSQTSTYKNKNKGNGRFSRMKRYHEGKSY